MKNKRKNGGRRYDPFVALEHLVRDDTSSRLGSVHVQKSVEHITSLDVFYEEECESRCSGEVLERYRGEDAGDLKRSELELVENWTCLNDPREDFF